MLIIEKKPEGYCSRKNRYPRLLISERGEIYIATGEVMDETDECYDCFHPDSGGLSRISKAVLAEYNGSIVITNDPLS